MRLPIVTISIALVTMIFYLLGGAMPEQLIWHQGEATRVWQWISAHFSHISIEHLTWNIAALLILGGIIEQSSRKVLGLAIVCGIVGVNIYLATFFSLNAYAGLSGALNALLIVALYFLYQHADYKGASVITLVLSLIKILVEYSFELSLFSTLPWPAVPQAHLAGLVGGALLVIFLELRKHRLLNSELVTFDEVPHTIKTPTIKIERKPTKQRIDFRFS